MTVNDMDPLADNPKDIPRLDSDLLNPSPHEDGEIIASFFTTVPKLLTSMTIDPPSVVPQEEDVYDRKQFWIRLANTPERREQAGLLVDRMYARQGYKHEDIIQNTPHTITIVAYGREGQVIGTVTIRMDSPEEGLLADEGYREELDKLRTNEKKICEFNGLAVDSSVRSKLVIARLFHIAMLYPWGLFGFTDCVIEVTPVHARFYERMLGFKRLGGERICPRVNTVGVLLHADFFYVNKRLEEVGGLMENAIGDPTLFPYGFSKDDAKGILGRLQRMI